MVVDAATTVETAGHYNRRSHGPGHVAIGPGTCRHRRIIDAELLPDTIYNNNGCPRVALSTARYYERNDTWCRPNVHLRICRHRRIDNAGVIYNRKYNVCPSMAMIRHFRATKVLARHHTIRHLSPRVHLRTRERIMPASGSMK